MINHFWLKLEEKETEVMEQQLIRANVGGMRGISPYRSKTDYLRNHRIVWFGRDP